MSVMSDAPAKPKTVSLRPVPMLIFGSRWLQVPLYIGLIIAQGIYVVLFIKELWHLFAHAFDFSEQQIMLAVLGLIDVVMISNLLVMDHHPRRLHPVSRRDCRSRQAVQCVDRRRQAAG
jgi:uncharacterized protein (TIGR00645 family)